MSLLSVIIPSFNEEENIENTAETLRRILLDNHIDYELIFVDDGSRDKTFTRILGAGATRRPRSRDTLQPQLRERGLHLRRAGESAWRLLRRHGL